MSCVVPGFSPAKAGHYVGHETASRHSGCSGRMIGGLGGGMRRPIVLGVLLAAGSVSIGIAAMAQAPVGQEARVVDIDKLRDNLYVMKGGGGNSSVFLAANGVVVIDTKNPGWGQPLLDAIRKVTDKPVTTIVNTHTHG